MQRHNLIFLISFEIISGRGQLFPNNFHKFLEHLEPFNLILDLLLDNFPIFGK